MISRWQQWVWTWWKHSGPEDYTQLQSGLKQCKNKQEMPFFLMLFFTFVWKEDRGSLGKKLFPLFQAKVRCFRGRPPFPEWLDSISLVATPSLSPPLVRLPPNFLILLSLTILSRLQSPLQFLPPFSPHFSFQCFFFPPICCNRALCQQAGLSSWPSSAHPPCGSCLKRVACGQESNRRSFPTLCFGALLGKKARISRTSETMSFCTLL